MNTSCDHFKKLLPAGLSEQSETQTYLAGTAFFDWRPPKVDVLCFGWRGCIRTPCSREVRQLRLQNERLSLPKVQDRLLHLIKTEGTSGRYKLNGSIKEMATQQAVTHEALYRVIARSVHLGQIDREDAYLALKFATLVSKI
jgi:hypothetical protein